MSKKRPGVEAAMRLIKSPRNISLWSRIESQFSDIISSVDELKTCNDEYEALREQITNSNNNGNNEVENRKDFLTKEELMVVIRWKFSVGKKRHALMKHLNSNSQEEVQKFTRRALILARDMKSNDEKSLKAAIEEITNLRGVGPASASAILTMVRPDFFCYMYDEAIDCFLPKRTYTLPIYLKVNEECKSISDSMDGWTPCRVAKVLWLAARACAWGKEDYTLHKDDDEKDDSARVAKRRRKS